MALSIRLSRTGKKGIATYRIVAMDKTKQPKSNYIESMGTYNPHLKENAVQVNEERVLYWMQRGAELSEGVRKLLGKKLLKK